MLRYRILITYPETNNEELHPEIFLSEEDAMQAAVLMKLKQASWDISAPMYQLIAEHNWDDNTTND